MNMAKKLLIQAMFFGALGSLGSMCVYLFNLFPTPQTATEIVRTLGNFSAIAGILVGWSIGWISQTRTLIQGIKYSDRAEELFHKLGDVQIELIWRWIFVVACSMLAVFCAIIINPPINDTSANATQPKLYWMLFVSIILISVAIGYVFCLLVRMIDLTKLKIELDNYEFEELRKKQIRPETEEEELWTKNY